MTIEVNSEINDLKSKAAKATESNDALRFSQAALNLAHAYATVVAAKKHQET